ncbi:hypothetical protein V8B55DRAFT_1498373 [Mucor lusitanicus]|uniref:Uncharacterized protein n=2 Tax=Mucor circinelloides f. lusitanicus TaxID=29924 RepID=A0A168MVB3_MUCCL|nr:hypothetical protein FB192DRAFT_1358751 [Mucor lusitanicus]OAD05413.1 hypothetical protein MUCCIDRAFT_80499 [Mucor lusitanicus CBS 277.49]
MNPAQLEKALNEMPAVTLITEIPEIQNAIAHLLKSNQEMREFDPDSQDPDFIQAIKENADLIKRKEKQVDMTLQVIRERLGEAAWREMGSNVKEFRELHAHELKAEQQPKAEKDEEEGVFL